MKDFTIYLNTCTNLDIYLCITHKYYNGKIFKTWYVNTLLSEQPGVQGKRYVSVFFADYSRVKNIHSSSSSALPPSYSIICDQSIVAKHLKHHAPAPLLMSHNVQQRHKRASDCCRALPRHPMIMCVA